MIAIIRDMYWQYCGLPHNESRELRWAIRMFGKNVNVVPYAARRRDEDALFAFGCRIAQYEGRPCVWVALSGIFVIFDIDDVKDNLRRLLRGRLYTWQR